VKSLAIIILLALSLVPVAQARHARPVPAKIVHSHMRGKYLAHGCAPLDYWHVICPQPAPH